MYTDPERFVDAQKVVKASSKTVLLHHDGRISARGNAKTFPVDTLGAASDIAVDRRQLCALVDGRVWCVSKDRPAWDTGIDQAVQLVSMEETVCARQETGRVKCLNGPLQAREVAQSGGPPTVEIVPGVLDAGIEDVVDLDSFGPFTLRAVHADGGVSISQGGRYLGPIRQLSNVQAVAPGRSDINAGNCAIAGDGAVWCWQDDRLVDTGARALSISGTQEPLWLTEEGHVEVWYDGAVRRAVDDLWPSPPDDLRVGGLPWRGCAYVPGGEARCWGEDAAPAGPLLDWTVEGVVHAKRGVLLAKKGSFKPVTFQAASGRTLPAPKRARLTYKGVLGDGALYRCDDTLKCKRILPHLEFVDARGYVALDADGLVYDHDGRVVFEGASALGDGSVGLIDTEGTAWSLSAPGYEGWRPRAAVGR
ncbi:MAG: hypothetical protein EA397_19785 [Deltaproteobacteria bacterium]|nr:MAG: hypothetical protein EA397_19785 [Deltaproteobacteria bacterium]